MDREIGRAASDATGVLLIPGAPGWYGGLLKQTERMAMEERIMVRFTGTRAGAFRVAFYLMIVLGVTADMRGDSSGSAKAGQRGAAPAATSGDSDEWDRMLTKLGGAPASTAATTVQPAKTSTAAKA